MAKTKTQEKNMATKTQPTTTNTTYQPPFPTTSKGNDESDPTEYPVVVEPKIGGVYRFLAGHGVASHGGLAPLFSWLLLDIVDKPDEQDGGKVKPHLVMHYTKPDDGKTFQRETPWVHPKTGEEDPHYFVEITAPA